MKEKLILKAFYENEENNLDSVQFQSLLSEFDTQSKAFKHSLDKLIKCGFLECIKTSDSVYINDDLSLRDKKITKIGILYVEKYLLEVNK